jgi:hypothetical protein
MDKTGEDGAGRTGQPQCADHEPAAWISTEQLEDELFNAIQEDYSGSCDDEAFDDSDDMFEVDDLDDEDEDEQRRGTLRLLSIMRPKLAELLGGPPVKEEVQPEAKADAAAVAGRLLPQPLR